LRSLAGDDEEPRESEEQLRLALEESEERFRAAFGSAAIGMALISIEGRYLQVNPKMCEITGYSEGELIGESFENITHPDDLEDDLEGVRRLLGDETRYFYFEKRYLHKSGREGTKMSLCLPLFTPSAKAGSAER
jgi:PAS domain S-box-containing protein